MPRLTVCPHAGCPELMPVGASGCDEHKRKPWVNPSRRNLERPTDWPIRVRKVKRRDGNRCRWLNGHARCSARGTEVDHILSVANGGTWELDNLWLLCHDHHTEKTRLEREQRNAARRG